MLDIVQDCTVQDSRTVMLQNEEESFYEARSIENQVRPIENLKLQILNQA